MNELPCTSEISVFNKKTLGKLGTCILLDLTKVVSPNASHFDAELQRHWRRRKNFANLGNREIVGIERLGAEGAAQLVEQKVSQRPKRLVLIYGFHEELLPQLVRELTARNIKHTVVLSNTQNERMNEGNPVEIDVEKLTRKLKSSVN